MDKRRFVALVDLAPAMAALAAIGFAIKGWTLLKASDVNFDAALFWEALALVFLAVASLPVNRLRHLRLAVGRELLTRHRGELAVLALVLGLGLFMRLYGFGTLPPTEGTGFEESQTGGIAYAILNHGLRPIEFAITNYTAALGFDLFGYSTTALRLPFLVAGIASLIPFYILLRLLVSAPASLFATALLAVNRWDAFSVRFADELFFGMNLAIVAVLLLVVVLKRGNLLAAALLGLFAGALNYEYVSYRQLPYLIVGALVAVFAFKVVAFLRRARTWRKGLPRPERIWLLPVVFGVALFLAVAPLAASSLRGDRVYYEAFSRHHFAESGTGVLRLLPAAWETRLKWTVQVFLPFGPKDYPESVPLNLPGERMLDFVTAGLLILAMAYALMTLHKPYRLFFALWLFAGLFVGGVIPENFYFGRFTGLLPAFFVLIAFAADDFLGFAAKRNLSRLAYGLLVPLAAWAFVANFSALNREIDSQAVRREFASPLVNLCRFMKDVGPDTYIYVWAEGQPTNVAFERSDFDWICQAITGEYLNSSIATWPIPTPEHARVAFVFLTYPGQEPDPADHLPQGYSSIALPTKVLQPFESYILRAFVLSREDVTARQGLDGTYLPDGQTRIEAATLFTRGGRLGWPEGASNVRLEGLVLLRKGGEVGLAPTKPAPARVVIDGLEVYSSDGTTESFRTAPLISGWHKVEITLSRDDGQVGPFIWKNGQGQPRDPLSDDDLFAVTSPAGWTHEITARGEGKTVATWQTIDPYPASGPEVLRLPYWLNVGDNPQHVTQASAVEEKWRSRWHVQTTGRYSIQLKVHSGVAAFSLDGTPILSTSTSPQESRTENLVLDLASGDHVIEINFAGNGGPQFGVSLDLRGPEGPVGPGSFEPF